jgi:hypothetical protein
MTSALAHSQAPLEPLPRTLDATGINAIANSADVRPGLGMGEGVLDFTEVVSNPLNMTFADQRGGFICQALGGGRYELHTVLAPISRGATALRLCADVLRTLFVETNCIEVVTRVPGNLRAADFMARRIGFREVWTMQGAWPGPDGPTSLRLFCMTLDEWMMKAPGLKEEGDAFHDLLRQASGSEATELHPHEDETHDRAAGMACLMAKAGNHSKALWSYGRWAQLAGYGQLQMISENPPIYETGGTLIQVRQGALEVLKWSPRQ